MSENSYLAKNPPIEQIRLGTKLYDIKTRKDWSENDVEDIGYIQNRTHYFYEISQKDIKAAFDEDPASDAARSLKTDFTAYHEFKNRYYANKDLCYRDYWYPGVRWLEEGKKYTLIIKPTANAEKLPPYHVELNSTRFYPDGSPAVDANGNALKNASQVLYSESSETGTKNRVIYNFAEKNIYIEFEDTSTTNEGFIETNGFALTIAPFIGEATEEEAFTSYATTKHLDARFLPLDGTSLHIDSDGNLKADDIFPNNFKVSYQFGQYLASTEVSAQNKSVKDVILDAFCRDVNPKTNIEPNIAEFTIKPITAAENGYYELGEEIKYGYTVKFDPGKYEFGVSKGKEVQQNTTSDIVIKANSGKFSIDAPTLPAILPDAEFETTTSRDPYENIGWGGGDNRIATLTVDNSTISMPNEANSNITATYIVEFDHINLKNITDPIIRATTALEYLPCTMFGIPIASSTINKTCFHAPDEFVPDELDETKTKIKPKTCTKTTDAFKCDYRWFWGYVNADEKVSEEDIQDLRGWLLNDQNKKSRKSKLGGFDPEFKTFRMKAMYFLAPKGQVESFEVEAADGSNPIMDEQTGTIIEINDAGGTPHKYNLWVFKDAVPDISTHIYKIKYTQKEATN